MPVLHIVTVWIVLKAIFSNAVLHYFAMQMHKQRIAMLSCPGWLCKTKAERLTHGRRMGGRTLNVAYAEPKQHEQQQAQQQPQAQPKVRGPHPVFCGDTARCRGCMYGL